jgi:hypothetical protein
MIICRKCRAEAHPLRDDYYATGCDCVPLELVEVPPACASAWDALVQAMNARDVAVSNAAARVEREFAGVIELRRQAYLAAVERERKQ